jgi:hypothetical protein
MHTTVTGRRTPIRTFASATTHALGAKAQHRTERGRGQAGASQLIMQVWFEAASSQVTALWIRH